TRRFLPLFATQFLGAFNDNVYKNALIIFITYQLAAATGSNAQILVTLAAGIFILPFFLFSATAGQVADKIEKARLIVIIKFAEILLMLLAAIGFYLHSIPIMMGILFLLGTQATFFGPVKYSILPVQLHSDELIAGNGLIEAGTFLSILLGTIVGGLLILLPFGESIISIILLTIAITGFVSSLYIPTTKIENPDLVVRYNFLHETIRVIQYSKKRWDIYLSILGISWFWLVGAVFLTEFPVFAKDILHANAHVVSWFIALFSTGIAIGSLLCNRLLNGRVHATYVPIGVIGMTIFAIDLYVAARHGSALSSTTLMGLGQFMQTFTGWRISIDLLLLAICSGLYTVPLYAILQERSDPKHRARVIASNNILNALFMVIAAVGTVIMLKMHFTVNDVFLTIALLNALVAVYICKLLPDLLLKEILRIILKMLYRVEVVGMENYDHAGERVVIIANHTSFLDAALLAAFLPEKFTFAVDTQTAKKRWVKFFLRVVDAYPIDPTNPIALKSLIEYVKKNKKCVIFPEGRITVTGALMKIYEGPGLIADKADAMLLPICIQGAQHSFFSRMKGRLP
ncbi:MAG TPA: MFS transporter, partial [Gammaproteobacteria bacterium]|nr:MFS transporter [Gammaproteobacteria bacterium]